MKALLGATLLLAAAAAAGAAWFRPVRDDIAARPATPVNAAGQPLTARPLSFLSAEDRKAAEDLRAQVDALDARLDAHNAAMSAQWGDLIAGVYRENARRKVESARIAGLVASSGLKPVEAQVEDMMDDTARRRVKGVLQMMMDGEIRALKSKLSLAPQQSATLDQIVQDIMKEEGAKVDSEEPGDNLLGWRTDVLQSARQKLQERVDPVLTSEQKAQARDILSNEDWGRAFRQEEEGK